MSLNENKSYNNIIEYIRSNDSLDDNEKRFLIHYASTLILSKKENKKAESIPDILDSVKKYNEYIKKSSDTSIVSSRIDKILKIIDMIADYFNGVDNVVEIGYCLDKLFLESDMGIRDTSSLSNSLQMGRKGRLM